MTYEEFLASKAMVDPPTGLTAIPELPSVMFQHQSAITRWALRRGRAAIFAGTGLGKALMELAWADAIVRSTGRDVLILAPLAVAAQLVKEAYKFGIPARSVSSQSDVHPGISITNYQKLHHFDVSHFFGVALDESSILKNYSGHYRTELIERCKSVPFRLAATATPAPNDFMELGNHAEFLGVMSYTDMLATFFVHDGGETQKWRLKGHAEEPFWRWMASWAVMLGKPSDLGYPDDGYDLPPLRQHNHVVKVDYRPSLETGTLFPMQARTLKEQRSARKDSIGERVALAASITPGDRQFVWWCNLNEEAQRLNKAIPGSVEISGSDDDDVKERAIQDFLDGRIRVLISKVSIFGFGMNLQCCADTGFVGMNNSFEQVFQAVRRFWRFGQTKPVNVHFVSAETEGNVIANLKRKEADAEKMAAAMVRHMADLSADNVRGAVRDTAEYAPEVPVQLPEFLRRAA